jgi:hypothetical protein
LTLNPEKLEKYRKECCRKIDGINYFSNPSEQVPNKENIKTFTKIMDNSQLSGSDPLLSWYRKS